MQNLTWIKQIKLVSVFTFWYRIPSTRETESHYGARLLNKIKICTVDTKAESSSFSGLEDQSFDYRRINAHYVDCYKPDLRLPCGFTTTLSDARRKENVYHYETVQC